MAPVEGCAIDADTVKNDGEFARDGDLCLSYANPLGELHALSLERGPFLRSIKQDGRGLVQVSSKKAVAPS